MQSAEAAIPPLPCIDRRLWIEELDLSDKNTCRRYFEFRTDYFGRNLGWDVLNDSGIDRDELDAVSVHYGLRTNDGRIVGCIRLTPPSDLKWMVDGSPFVEIIDREADPAYPRQQCLEVSRLGIDLRFATVRDEFGYTSGQALRRAAYRHSLKLGQRYWYIVAYRALIRALQRQDHLPFRIISPAVHFDERGTTCVACLDLAEAYVRIAARSPAFLHWSNVGVSHAELSVLGDGILPQGLCEG